MLIIGIIVICTLCSGDYNTSNAPNQLSNTDRYSYDTDGNSSSLSLSMQDYDSSDKRTDNSKSKKDEAYSPNYVWFSKEKRNSDIMAWFSNALNDSDKKEADSKREYKIRYETKFLHYGDVGSEWDFYLKNESGIIESGDSISGKGKIELTVIAVEYDDSSDDIGTQTITISPSDSFPMTKTTIVTVKESYGKGAGSTAEIQFTITIEKVK